MVKLNESEVTRALNLINDALKENKDETKRLLDDRYSNVRDMIIQSMRAKRMAPSTVKRVPIHTPKYVQSRIFQETVNNVAKFVNASPDLIKARLNELDNEWDIERLLETNASTLILTGVLLSRFNRRLMLIPVAVSLFLLQHAIQGWCPPIPLFRKLGIRTQREIDIERYALKRIRGDFGQFNIEEKDPQSIAMDLLRT